MESLKKRYRDLETETFGQIGEKIIVSKKESNYYDTQAVRIDYGPFEEIVIIDDRILLIDGSGNCHSIYSIPLEDLIDILMVQL